MATRKKRACKNGRTKAGKCRKTRRKAAGGKRCRTVKVKSHKRKMCKKGGRWMFSK